MERILVVKLVAAYFLMINVCWSQKSGDTIFDNTYVHEIKIVFNSTDFLTQLQQNYESTPQEPGNDVPYVMAKVIIDDEEVDSIGVRYKGFTSYTPGAKKNPLKIDFNEFVPGKRYDGMRKINLNNGTGDPSMMRDVICYDLLNSMGVNAPRTAYANVYFNENLVGLYQLIEQVDKEFLTNNFSNDDGNLFKNKGWSKLEYNGNQKENYNNIFELKTNKLEDDWSGFIDLMHLLNNSSDQDFEQFIESKFDVNRYLKTLAVDVATNNWDSYLEHGRNWYMYEDTNTGVFRWIPWDYNFSLNSDGFGGVNDFCWLFADFAAWTDGTETVKFLDASYGAEEEDVYMYTFDDGNTSSEKNPTYTFSEAGEHEVCLMITHSETCYDNKCFTIDTRKNYNDCSSIQDHPSINEANASFVQTVYVFEECCSQWTGFCQEIYDFYESIENETDNNDFSINQDDNEGVLIKRLMGLPKYKELYYDNVCSMLKNNLTTDRYQSLIGYNKQLIENEVLADPNYGFSYQEFKKDTEEEGLISILNSRISKLNEELNSTYVCKETQSINFGDVVINELVASTDSTYTTWDDAKEVEDWIELYNNTNTSIDLSGIYLSDSKDEFNKWQFPIGTNIEGQGYLIVWADKDEDQQGVHCNFKLNKNGDELKLSNVDGTVIDSVSFGEQTVNTAYARIPNGTGDFTFRSPTFAYNNDNTSGNSEVASPIMVNIFPNPTKGVLNIKIEDNQQYMWEIYSNTGLRLDGSTIPMAQSTSIDLSHLKAGFYTIQLRDFIGGITNLKFVKM